MEEAKGHDEGGRDVLDWVIFSGGTTEKELSEKTGLSGKAVADAVGRLEGRGVLKRRRGFLRTEVLLDPSSDEAKAELSMLSPAVEVVGVEKRFKTSLDLVKHIVDRFGRARMARFSRFFNTTDDVVESWAKILHAQGMIVLFYPVVGGPVLLKTGERGRVVNYTLIRYLVVLLAGLILFVWRQELADVLKNV
jgi:hypothetical protein